MKISCLQTNPGLDIEKNMLELEQMLFSIKKDPTLLNVTLLPEVFAVMGSDTLRRTSANHLGEGIFRTISQWAAQTGQYLVAGTHGEISSRPGKVYNTATVFSDHGALLDVYRKIHLFNLKDAHGEPLYCESDVFAEGLESSTYNIKSEDENWHCMTIVCYDLRFPEIVRREISRSGPLDILFVPAAFTHQTGQDHWEILLRARAIENQCYVVACNQTGWHTEGRKRNWGHSMIIDPWGKIVAQLQEEVGILQAAVSKEEIRSARLRLPALHDRVFKL